MDSNPESPDAAAIPPQETNSDRSTAGAYTLTEFLLVCGVILLLAGLLIWAIVRHRSSWHIVKVPSAAAIDDRTVTEHADWSACDEAEVTRRVSR